MDLRDKLQLRQLGDREVWIALHHRDPDPDRVVDFLGGPAARFDYISTVFARTSAMKALAATSEEFYVDAELVDDRMARRTSDLLTELFRVVLYDHLGSFRLAVLNLSLGPPKALLNTGRSAEKAVHRAFRVILDDLDVPIVVSAGNDGPNGGTLNTWGQAPGVILAAAADEDGTRIWPRSSRPLSYAEEDSFHLFAAHGENTIGALPRGEEKTDEMLAAEAEVDLASVVGAANVDYFSVRSGTSFAAAWVSRILCFAHQMIQVLDAYMSSVRHRQGPIPPFVRGFIDTGIDETHPIFDKRLVDKRFKYSGQIIDIDLERKRRLFEFFAGNAIDVRLHYGVATAVQFLKQIACPIPGACPEEAGNGFVSFELANAFVREARYSTLIALLAHPEEPRLEQWLHAAQAVGDPLLFSPDEALSIHAYSQDYDLVLALPLSHR